MNIHSLYNVRIYSDKKIHSTISECPFVFHGFVCQEFLDGFLCFYVLCSSPVEVIYFSTKYIHTGIQ